MRSNPLATNPVSPCDRAVTQPFWHPSAHNGAHSKRKPLSVLHYLPLLTGMCALQLRLTHFVSLHTASFALLAELRLLLLSCANLPVRTVSALCCMRTSLVLPFARPSQRCHNTDCAVHLTTNTLQALTCDKQRYTLEHIVGSGNHGERLLLRWKIL